jgi:hypothetical protein
MRAGISEKNRMVPIVLPFPSKLHGPSISTSRNGSDISKLQRVNSNSYLQPPTVICLSSLRTVIFSSPNILAIPGDKKKPPILIIKQISHPYRSQNGVTCSFRGNRPGPARPSRPGTWKPDRDHVSGDPTPACGIMITVAGAEGLNLKIMIIRARRPLRRARAAAAASRPPSQ